MLPERPTYPVAPERDEDAYEPASAEERFRQKFRVQADGCWVWTAFINKGGYGQFYYRRPMVAHRFAYEFFVGPIPDGLQLDHLCRNRACVNPDHLEPVTQAENIRRGESGAYLKNRARCKNGHEFSGDNFYVRGGARICRLCEAARKREYVMRVAGACRDCGKQLANVNATRCNSCNQKWRNL